MDLNLQGKTALITGANQGIGKEIAIQLAKEGVRVCITAREQRLLNEVAEEIHKVNGDAITIKADVTHRDDLEKLSDSAITQLGKIDILINNVGHIGRVASFEETSDEEWHYLFNLNVMSGIHLSQAVISPMRKQKWGRILFISSERAISPGVGLAPYAMTKAALLSVAKSLANECGQYGITVNAISPGVILTPAWDAEATKANMSREKFAAQFCDTVISKEELGLPIDVAVLACFLSSDLARWITGSNFRVDGGAVSSIQL